MNALVRVEQDRVLADSRDVAREFGKEHRHVLRAIDTIVKEAPELLPNFGQQLFEVDQGNGAKRRYRRYDMDRKGFMLLVMGFNGAKALAIKSRWIDAFDAMERALTLQAIAYNDDDDEPALPATAGGMMDFAPALAVIREARQVFGRAAAQRLWPKLGLPDVVEHPAGPNTRAVLCVPETMTDWLAAKTRPAAEEWVQASVLYGSYLAWCDDMRVRPENRTRFGRTLERMGYSARKNGAVFRRGLELID